MENSIQHSVESAIVLLVGGPNDELTVGEPSIWVIDPLGNVASKFEPGINPTLILQDLKKVVEGIEGGLMANNLPLKLATIALF